MELGFLNIFAIGMLMLSGLMAGALSRRLGIPRVACYLVAGAIFSPSLLGQWVTLPTEGATKPLTNIALGIIAFIIGGSITVEQMQRLGKTMVGIAVGQSLGAVILVFSGIFFLMPQPFGEVPVMHLALALAAISATTAPAGTIALLHQYRAKGPLSTTLLGVVALDDVLGIVMFAIVMSLISGNTLSSNVGAAFVEIFYSIVFGLCGGYLLAKAVKPIQRNNLMLALTLAAMMLTIGAAGLLHLSILLTPMALGFFSRFFLRSSGDKLFTPIEILEETVFLLFFTIAGIHFLPSAFIGNLPLIGIYLSTRIIGKVIGSALGAKMTGAPPAVTRYLGLALLPQAGVAIGLVLVLSQTEGFESISDSIVNFILATTMVNELLGPIVAKYALFSAGEMGAERKADA